MAESIISPEWLKTLRSEGEYFLSYRDRMRYPHFGHSISSSALEVIETLVRCAVAVCRICRLVGIGVPFREPQNHSALPTRQIRQLHSAAADSPPACS
jgi:hypothetical protein